MKVLINMSENFENITFDINSVNIDYFAEGENFAFFDYCVFKRNHFFKDFIWKSTLILKTIINFYRQLSNIFSLLISSLYLWFIE